MRKKIALLLVCVMVFSVLALGCGGGGKEEPKKADVVKVGVLLP